MGDASLRLLLGRELQVGGTGWMNGERAGAADVGDVIKYSQRVDEICGQRHGSPLAAHQEVNRRPDGMWYFLR